MVKLFYHMLKRYCINLCLFEIMQQEFPFSFKLSFINILDKKGIKFGGAVDGLSPFFYNLWDKQGFNVLQQITASYADKNKTSICRQIF